MRRAFLLLGVMAVVSCAKAGASDGATGEVLAAWQKAGLEPATFEPLVGSPYGQARCRTGKVKGIEATVCEHDDVAEARRAETAALAAITEGTGLALAEGKLLLVLVDRGADDPSGKKMNEIARTFRNR
jgi:hypothetical protein